MNISKKAVLEMLANYIETGEKYLNDGDVDKANMYFKKFEKLYKIVFKEEK